MKASLDKWDGVFVESIDHVHPTSEEVVTLFRMLDQEIHTILSLEVSENKFLMVGGGNGQYIVTGNTEENHILEIRFDGPDVPTVPMFVGGQPGDFPPNLVVDEKIALDAALTFLKTETFAPQYPWRDIGPRW